MGPRRTREHQREEQAGWVTDRQSKLVSVVSQENSVMANPLRHRGDGPPEQRRYPQHEQWKAVVKLFENFSSTYGTEGLLASVALGKVAECPFPSDEVKNLKTEVVRSAATNGYDLRREAADRSDTPIDFRFLQLLLTVAGDPEVHFGGFSLGVRVGPGARLPRLPALHPAKKRWRLTEQSDPRNYLEQGDTVSMWRSNYASLDLFSDKVLEVLEDQTKRGQVIKITEPEARQRYPNLVVASLGAQRKDKPGGAVSACVHFDGTHGITVNTKTRIRDQERGPIAADLKRREEPRRCPYFRLNGRRLRSTPTDPDRRTGLASPRVSSGSWWFSLHQHSGYVWRRVSIILLVSRCICHRPHCSVLGRQLCLHLAHVGR